MVKYHGCGNARQTRLTRSNSPQRCRTFPSYSRAATGLRLTLPPVDDDDDGEEVDDALDMARLWGAVPKLKGGAYGA